MVSSTLLAQFIRTRWLLDFRDRARLEAWQQKRLQYFLRHILPQARRYQGRTYHHLSELPMMDKSVMMQDFAACNTLGVDAESAFQVAIRAEQTRDFSPMLGNVTVGLSSGTSGNRGLFLATAEERQRWAGILLARTLPENLLRHLLTPWKPPLRIAFFLRANSNLYTTLSSRRIDFRFYDLMKGAAASLPALNRQQPHVLVAPPAMLWTLSETARQGSLAIAPQHMISVADVLEDSDRHAVQAVFHRPVHQIYQATEGFLAYTCEHGALHLNEAFVHIEPDWLDKAHTRFQPVITDFTRTTQLIVRYRLNDILRVADTPCACGRADRTIAAVEGRADEVLWLPRLQDGQGVAVFPDLLRRAMLYVGNRIAEYRITQQGMVWHIDLLCRNGGYDAAVAVGAEFERLWHDFGVVPPELVFHAWQPSDPSAKRRRIRLLSKPEGLS